MSDSINNTVGWPDSISLPSYYCPDCRISRIPPFLMRCSRCCDTDYKKALQVAACELNKDFYSDFPVKKWWEFWI